MSLKTQYESLSGQGIDDFIANKQVEHLQLDFKTINDADLNHRDDRKTLAKAMSGFSNSNGGLIIWGVVAEKNDEGIAAILASSYNKNHPQPTTISRNDPDQGEGYHRRTNFKTVEKPFHIVVNNV